MCLVSPDGPKCFILLNAVAVRRRISARVFVLSDEVQYGEMASPKEGLPPACMRTLIAHRMGLPVPQRPWSRSHAAGKSCVCHVYSLFVTVSFGLSVLATLQRACDKVAVACCCHGNRKQRFGGAGKIELMKIA